MNHIKQKQQEIADNIYKSYNTPGLEKAEEVELEKGGKKAFIGEKREFGGRMYIKTAAGWKFFGKGTGSKAKDHHEKHTGETKVDPGTVEKVSESAADKLDFSVGDHVAFKNADGSGGGGRVVITQLSGDEVTFRRITWGIRDYEITGSPMTMDIKAFEKRSSNKSQTKIEIESKKPAAKKEESKTVEYSKMSFGELVKKAPKSVTDGLLNASWYKGPKWELETESGDTSPIGREYTKKLRRDLAEAEEVIRQKIIAHFTSATKK